MKSSYLKIRDSAEVTQGRRDLLKAGGMTAIAAVAPLALGLTGCSISSQVKELSSTPPRNTEGNNRMTKSASISGRDLPRRKLGQLEVTAIGFGSMNVVHAYGPSIEPSQAVRTICRAYDLGVRFFDTAEVYGPFASEALTGEALQGVRDDLVLCTKFGFDITEQGKVLGVSSRPEVIRRACEQSLRRLRTDRIDLLYQHRVDPNVPIEEVAGVVQDLIREGKVLHFGLSSAGAATIRRAHAVQPVTAVQNHYAFWSRQPEVEVLQACEELNIGFVPWSPLGMGYLTGTVAPETRLLEGDLRASSNFPRFTPEARRANWGVVNLLQKVGRLKGATSAQVALAWLLARKPWIVPIPGTTKPSHIQENIGAIDVLLSADELKLLDDEFSRTKIQGVYTGINEMAAIDIGDREGSSSAGGHGLSPLPAVKR